MVLGGGRLHLFKEFLRGEGGDELGLLGGTERVRLDLLHRVFSEECLIGSIYLSIRCIQFILVYVVYNSFQYTLCTI